MLHSNDNIVVRNRWKRCAKISMHTGVGHSLCSSKRAESVDLDLQLSWRMARLSTHPPTPSLLHLSEFCPLRILSHHITSLRPRITCSHSRHVFYLGLLIAQSTQPDRFIGLTLQRAASIIRCRLMSPFTRHSLLKKSAADP